MKSIFNIFDLFSKALPKRSFNAPVEPKFSKHQASKKGAKHELRGNGRIPVRTHNSLTNHQRVVISRAARMGLSVKEYEIKFCK